MNIIYSSRPKKAAKQQELMRKVKHRLRVRGFDYDSLPVTVRFGRSAAMGHYQPRTQTVKIDWATVKWALDNQPLIAVQVVIHELGHAFDHLRVPYPERAAFYVVKTGRPANHVVRQFPGEAHEWQQPATMMATERVAGWFWGDYNEQPGEAFADAFLKAFGGLDGVDPEDWRYPSDEDVEQLRRLGGMK